MRKTKRFFMPAMLLLALNFIFINDVLAFRVHYAIDQEPVQVRRITGRITDSASNPLPGATITLRGTSRSALTDANGNFSIDANTGEVLVISSVGFESREMIIGESSSLSITMNATVITGQEVVVIGYQ